jgi:hypothetical protein
MNNEAATELNYLASPLAHYYLSDNIRASLLRESA